jgi:hypothetical protein
MEHELEGFGFFLFEVFGDLLDNKPEVLVIALLEVGGVGFDLVGHLD